MKKIFLLVSGILFLSNIIAQTTGVIHFEERVKLMIQTEDTDVPNDIAASLPKELKLSKLLYFTSDNSLYIKDEKSKQDPRQVEKIQEDDGPMIVMKMDEPEEKVFCDLKNNVRIEQRDLLDRLFLIESPLDRMQWKLTGNRKEILGYVCQEAILKDTLLNLKVWFTSELPVFSGPNGYANLPGMILECNRDEGKQIIAATKIDFKDFDKSIIVKPTEGKKISKDDYNALVEQKRKEMQEENGGDGNVIIKVRH